jgi:hypothetical protein
MRNRLAFTGLCLAVIAAGAAACAKDQPATQASDIRAQVARLQRATSLLQNQIDLAGGKDFYLVVDPGAPDITLMLRGAELQRYAVQGLQVGQPRVSWVTRPDPRPWQDVVWSHGELDPPRQIDRLVVQAAPPGKDNAEPEAQVPPTPEEMYPVPPRYHVRFDEGRSIEIRPLDVDAQAGRMARLRAWWSAKWSDAIAAMAYRERDAVRLRITLNPKDAASLYRSLPPAVCLIILSQESRPAPATAPRQRE